MNKDDFDKIRDTIPHSPGVYQFKDGEGQVLYVGKAKDIKKRVTSYFSGKYNQAYKTKSLVRASKSIDYILVNSESDALLLENNLIKKLQPKYNVNLKDGKSYTYLCIKNERFPRVFFTRRMIKDGSTYFGPYTSKYKAKIILDLIRNLFPLRTCKYNLSKENIEAGKFKVCLEYHIKRCLGPCENLETEENYNDRIDQIKNILKGNFSAVKDYLKSEMDRYVELLEFEKANELKDKLNLFEDYQSKSTVVNPNIENVDVFTIINSEHDDNAFVNYIKVVHGAVIYANTFELTKKLEMDSDKSLLAYAIRELREKYQSDAPEVYLPFKVDLFDEHIKVIVPKIGDKRRLIDLSYKNAEFYIKQQRKERASRARVSHSERILKTLQKDLQLEEVPMHIECFDNSNLGGSYPVSSCVVFRNARPSKKDYRHFNIKTVVGPNDFASMEEVVHRRYSRLLKEGESLPQLVIIDGGKGQLSASMKSISALGLENKITVIGIAKRLEEIFFPEDPIPVYINKKSESLKLIQQLRNEAHRFAITFHRNQRSKDFTKSALTEIPGIGEKISKKLLVEFKSVNKIKKLDKPTLESFIGSKKAALVYSYFHNEEE